MIQKVCMPLTIPPHWTVYILHASIQTSLNSFNQKIKYTFLCFTPESFLPAFDFKIQGESLFQSYLPQSSFYMKNFPCRDTDFAACKGKAHLCGRGAQKHFPNIPDPNPSCEKIKSPEYLFRRKILTATTFSIKSLPISCCILTCLWFQQHIKSPVSGIMWKAKHRCIQLLLQDRETRNRNKHILHLTIRLREQRKKL